MNLPDHIRPTAVDDALLNIGMTINEIRVQRFEFQSRFCGSRKHNQPPSPLPCGIPYKKETA